jgi:EAL domain-containing protein (putative c-di-GMP-specific phosphodiesterase class I)
LTASEARAPIVAGDARFLAFAFAFAFADLVVEFDEAWQILYATRLTETGTEIVRAQCLAELVDPVSLARIVPTYGRLGLHVRAEPLRVKLKLPEGRRDAVMRAFRARDLGGERISCIFTFGGEIGDAQTTGAVAESASGSALVGASGASPAGAAASVPRRQPGSAMLSVEALLARAAQILAEPEATRGQTNFTFIEFGGTLQAAERAALNADPAIDQLEALFLKVSLERSTAAQVGLGRYVLLTDRRTTEDYLNKAIAGLGRDVVRLSPRVSQTPVEDASIPDSSVRALRFALERFAGAEATADVAKLAAQLTMTLKDASEFRTAVKDGRFKLLYQPQVRLADEKVVRYEALLRLPGKDDIGASIRMAEQLGLIDPLDVAVAQEAWNVLEQDRTRELAISINISSQSLHDDGFIQGLISMTKRSQSIRNRFTVEITEAAALQDLEATDRRVQALRRMGFKVCVDDFGAGTASFDYLRALDIDLIKIDGRYVRELGSSQRARLLVGHFVSLCKALNIETLGGRTESRAVADVLRELGVDYAQGWFFGKPNAEPRTIDPAVAARRKGEQITWG